MTCPECDGEGEIEVLYSDGPYGYGMSNEEAMRMAGEVHHTEVCGKCGGSGEVEK